MQRILVAFTMLSMAFAAGCGPRKNVDGKACQSPQELTREAIESLRLEVDNLRADGRTNAVLPRIESALSDPALAEAHPVVFSMFISELVSRGRLNEAREAFLQVAGTKADEAQAAFGIISAHYDREGRPAELLDWLNTLIDLPLVVELRLRAWSAAVHYYIALGRAAEIPARVPAIFASLESEQDQIALLGRTAASMLEMRLYDEARQLLDTIKAQRAYGEAIERLIITSRADLLLAEGKLDEAEELLWANVPMLTDPEATRRFRGLMMSRMKDGDSAASDRIARRAMAALAGLTATRDTIVSLWIEAAADARDHNAFVERTEDALNARVSIRRVLGSFEQGIYDVMSTGPDTLRQRCSEILKSMGSIAEGDESSRDRLTLLKLDAAFYKEDFQEALEIINHGIPGRDENWHKVLINKVSAHLALQEGRIDDAIGHFRSHMETVKAWERGEVDPSTGVMMIKEAVLGFNEKRIGDIYAGAGRQAEAGQAYAAAREWYGKALKAVEADSEEFEVYQKEMALVPTT